MAQDTIVTGSKLTAIANAIRTKGGTSAQLTLDQMPQAVAAIPGGGGGFDVSVCYGISFYNGMLAGAPDLSSLDTSGFTSMGSMFYNCQGLTSLDLSGFDTGGVMNMSGMFSGCSGLTSLDLSNFDTGGVMAMSNMFYGCTALTSLDLSSFDTGGVTNMRYMFLGCSSLVDIIWSQLATVQPIAAAPSSMSITSSMKFYVPNNLVNAYKTATNWSSIASQIYPISDLPASVAALYGIGA